MEKSLFFRYKTQTTILHKVPASIKLVAMLALAIIAFYTPIMHGVCIWLALLAFSKIVLKFSFAEIISDLKPTLSYTVLLYSATLIMNILDYFSKSAQTTSIITIFKPNAAYTLLLVHLALSMEISSLFFRTTSITEFKNGIAKIERLITKKEKAPLSETITLTFFFIPRITSFYTRISNAWKARDGKDSIRKILVLIPLLLKLSMQDGYEKSLAIMNRN